MPHSRTTILLGALLCAAASASAQGYRHGRDAGEPGRFDYYAVALSWSPAFCATHDDPQQCAPGRGAGFVLHGLWPQYERGFPQECSTERLAPQTEERYAALYPSRRLAAHEWKQHGTCSGLNQAAYFELSEKLSKQVAIPPAFQRPAAPVRTSYGEFVQAFHAANPRMADNAVLPFCGGGGKFLNEIHVCYDKRGASTACGASEIRRSENTCRKQSFVLQSAR